MLSLLTEITATPLLDSDTERGIGSALSKLSSALIIEPAAGSPVRVTVKGDASRLCPDSVLVSVIVYEAESRPRMRRQPSGAGARADTDPL